MRRRRVVAGVVLALLLGWSGRPVFAVGTVTVTNQEVSDRTNRYREYTVSWTSDAAGAVSGNAFSVVGGRLAYIRFTPGSGGVQPTDLYDITLVETNGVSDYLDGLGANLSNLTSALLSWSPDIFQDGSRTLDVVVANAGNAKSGTVRILILLGQR